MSFAVGTYKEIKQKYRLPCMLCNIESKLSDPIIMQRNVFGNTDDITCVHITCFMKQIQEHFPDFWKTYILEMI